MRFKVIPVVLAILVAVCAVGPADAQSQSDEWQFQLVPMYLWAMDIGGTMTFRDRFDQDFQVNFSDAFDNLEAAYTFHFEAHKGRWSLFADYSYLNLSASQDINTPFGIVTADLGVKNNIIEGGAGYSFAENWWVIAGARYFKLDADIGFQLDIAPEIDIDQSWTDFFVGLEWRPKLGNRWTFAGRFDVGAGGSDLVWNAAALLDFQIGKWAAIVGGYRHLDYDYRNQNNGLAYDASMSGPFFGFRFFW
jgi:hypothetical protein